MTTIAVTGVKGGIGKTTSSLMLARAAVTTGRSVLLLDADPQQSASEWAIEAGEETMGFDVVATPSRAVLTRRAETARDKFDLVIIDTPNQVPSILDAAWEAADTLVLPTRPTPIDMRRLWEALDLLPGKDAWALLVDVDPHTAATRMAVTVLEEGGARLAGQLRGWQSFRLAYGTVPSGRALAAYQEVLETIAPQRRKARRLKSA